MIVLRDLIIIAGIWTPLESISPNATAALAVTAAATIADMDAAALAAGRHKSLSGNVADPWGVWDVMGDLARTAWQASRCVVNKFIRLDHFNNAFHTLLFLFLFLSISVRLICSLSW